MSNLRKKLNQAEANAKERERKKAQVLSSEEMQQANELQAKANIRGMKLIPEKKIKNKTKFAQVMQGNMKCLNKQGYLSSHEKGFLIDVMPYISFHSNSIVFDIEAKTVIPMNISELAKELDRPRQRISPVVNSLVKKGILAKAESGIEKNNAKAYSLFVNPHIIFAGDKDNVQEHLQVIFHKAMKMKVLKDLPNRLF